MESVFENSTLDALAVHFPPSFIDTMLDRFEIVADGNYGMCGSIVAYDR